MQRWNHWWRLTSWCATNATPPHNQNIMALFRYCPTTDLYAIVQIIRTLDLISIILYYCATNETGAYPIRHTFWELNPFPGRSNRNFLIRRLAIIHFRILFEFFIRPTIGSKINWQFILLRMCTLQQTSNWCSVFRLAPRNLFVIAPALCVYRKHNNSSRNSFCLR